jgi:heme oxygenase (mycobilin-producing)
VAFTVILDLKIKSDDVAGSPAVLRNVLDATRNFDGNLGVGVFSDTTDPAHVVVIESWESEDAVNAYQAWRRTPEGASILGDILAGAPAITRLNHAFDV